MGKEKRKNPTAIITAQNKLVLSPQAVPTPAESCPGPRHKTPATNPASNTKTRALLICFRFLNAASLNK